MSFPAFLGWVEDRLNVAIRLALAVIAKATSGHAPDLFDTFLL
jgi:hypothetical protein